MALSTRELLARLLKCEAGGEGENGLRAVASVIVNRTRVPDGEFARVSKGGDFRAIMEQPNQFTCLKTTVGGQYNPQNVYNIRPDEIHYNIADWALAGNTDSSVGNSIFYFNPFSDTCPTFFPSNNGVIYNRVGDHCFYSPTEAYSKT